MHLTIIRFSLINDSPYIPDRSSCFSSCGTMFPLLSLIAGHVALHGTSDGDRMERRVTRRDREVVNFKRHRVKNNSKLTNFEN